jgi:DNA polymerase-1
VDFDIMLAAYALNSGMGNFDLDRIAVTYLGSTPPAEAIRCFEPLCDTLTAELEKTAQMGVFRDMEMPLAAVLFDMERIGFTVDRDSMLQYGLVLDTLAAEYENRIYMFAGRSFNIKSPKQLG